VREEAKRAGRSGDLLAQFALRDKPTSKFQTTMMLQVTMFFFFSSARS
jgi:hypothetical protein